MNDLLANLADMFASPLMQRSFIVALLVGISAPIVGTYLVHRRLALMGDGIGHIALTGVALGWLAGTWLNLAHPEQLAIPGALVIAVIGALSLEAIRLTGRTSSDVALAILFYGGIAGGVLLISLAGGTSSQLNAYLFGSIATVTNFDISASLALAAAIILIGVGIGPGLFCACQDEDFSRSIGLPVGLLASIIALLAAFTVAIAMRVVGSLLVSAIMIVPVASAQVFARSFRSTMAAASLIGTLVCVTGLTITYFYNLSPGAAIVVLAIILHAGVYLTWLLIGRLKRRARMVVDDGAMHPSLPTPHDQGGPGSDEPAGEPAVRRS